MQNVPSTDSATSVSRRGFVLMGLMGSGAIGLSLAGCSPGLLTNNDPSGRSAIISDWLAAAKEMEITDFLNLHTEGIAYYTYQLRNPRIGREKLWSPFQASASDHLEDAFIFGNEQIVCVQTSSLDFARSHCYVLVFEGDLIDKIYEYAALYNIAADSPGNGRPPRGTEEEISEQVEIVDRLTDSLNARDLNRYLADFSTNAVINGFLATDPLEGKDAIQVAAEGFFQAYPNLQLRHYRTFGQGNLVCQQVVVEHGPVRSFSTVHAFDQGKITRTVEYFSHAKLIEL